MTIMRLIPILCFLTSFLLPSEALPQKLSDQRIRKIPNDKQSIYFEKGIFHNGKGVMSTPTTLKMMRHSITSASGEEARERLVFVFSTEAVPRTYGYFSGKKLYLDFLTQLLEVTFNFLQKQNLPNQ